MAVLTDSSTCHPREHWIQRSFLGCGGPELEWLVSDTLGEETSLGSHSLHIRYGTFVVAFGAVSRTSLVSSKWVSRASVAFAGGIRGLEHCLDAE